MAELKPCPFCGGEAEYVNFSYHNPETMTGVPSCYVKCTKCGVRTGKFVSADTTFSYKDTATRCWNERVVDNG